MDAYKRMIVSDILSKDNQQFVVPIYQREYKWTDTERSYRQRRNLDGKLKGPSIREQIEELQRDKLNGVVTCDMTVLELAKRYLIAIRRGEN